MSSDLSVQLIFGDDEETQVFAQAYSHDSFCIIFRYALSPNLQHSLSNRIVNCFHEVPVEDAGETFPDRDCMRKEVSASIRRVWQRCRMHPSIAAPDVVVEIYECVKGSVQWRLSHESLYKDYEETLLPISGLFQSE